MVTNSENKLTGVARHQSKVLIFFIILILVLLALTWQIISNTQKKLIEFESVQIAKVVANQATTARSLYSQSVVAKLKRDGFSASTNSGISPGSVPIPAQFLKNLAHDSSDKSNGQYSFRPISKWNLSPDQGLKDSFQKWAWNQLEIQNPDTFASNRTWSPVWRIENINGTKSLRYMYPDPASSTSCVNCNNAMESLPEILKIRQSGGVQPGKVWKINDLMGALEVTVPLKQSSEFAATQTRDGFLLFTAVTLAGILLVGAFAVFDAVRTRSMTRKLSHLATHDFLTSLPNRSGFELHQEEVLSDSDLNINSHAVLLLDLDDFKRINDTLGHEIGDAVLIETAQRLKQAVSDNDYIARLGGDEFAIFAKNTDADRAAELAEKIAAAFLPEVTVHEYRLSTRPSIGIAMMPLDGQDSKETLRCADVAMYVAKKDRTGYAFYHKEEDNNYLVALSTINDLKKALQNNELALHYQPKFDIRKGSLCGVEGLLRWNHPEHGMIPPMEIITVAERCGLIFDLTQWTLIAALSQLKEWNEENHKIKVSVNLSVQMLNDFETVNLILDSLNQTSVDPDKLIIEVTESGMIKDPVCAEKILNALNDAGVELSVDDFGTGHSSLSYLNNLPVHELKLDKSFVINMKPGCKNAVIVSAAIELAHNLGLDTVAEGVETRDSLVALKNFNCDIVQGCYLCRPIPADDLTKRIPELTLLAASLRDDSLKNAA